MAPSIKDPETERLAGEVVAMTGESRTGAVRVALEGSCFESPAGKSWSI